MQLVVLAAGHGRRFGGLKQLARVGPEGQALMDFTARSALEAGFDGVVLIVREEVREELLQHISEHWPSALRVTTVVQGPIAGTAQAVASAAPHVGGPFGVVNADDLYGDEAVATLASELKTLDTSAAEHVMVAYRLANTILDDAPVTRGVCWTDGSGRLKEIAEQKVQQAGKGRYIARPLGAGPEHPGRELTGDEDVSMNLWGFTTGIFEQLDEALGSFDPAAAQSIDGKPPEVLLPRVVGDLVARGQATVRVANTAARCIGITHPDDLALVRSIVAEELAGKHS